MTNKNELENHINVKDDFYEQLSKSETEDLVRILRQSSLRRTTKDVDQIMKATENFAFFKNYNMKEKYVDSDLHKKCCKQMTYEFHPKFSPIFQEGDQGNKLYFVLRGQLRSYVKMTPEELAQKKSPQKGKSQSPPRSDSNSHNTQLSHNSLASKVKIISNMKAFMTRHSLSAKRTTRLSNSLTTELVSMQTLKTENAALQPQPSKFFGVLKLETKQSEGLSDPHKGAKGTDRQRSSMANVFKTEVDLFAGDQSNRQAVNEEIEEGEEGEEEDTMVKGLAGMKGLDFFEAGQVFGEMALTTGSKRKETIVAMEDCHLAVLSKEDYDRLLLPLQKSGLKKRIEFIEMAFGLNLKWDKAAALTYMFKKVKVHKGQYIFREKEKGDGFYIVKSGEILILKELEYTSPEKREKTDDLVEEEIQKVNRAETPFRQTSRSPVKKGKYSVQLLKRGDFFGEEILIRYTNRLFDAECKTSSATLYYMAESQIEVFLWHMKDHLDVIIARAQQRLSWKNNRLDSSDKYVDKVLKASRNLDIRTKSTPLMRRTFAKDIPTTYAMINNESNTAKGYASGNSSSKKSSVSKAIRPKNELYYPEAHGPMRDTFSQLEKLNQANARVLSRYPESSDNPFDIKNGFFLVDPEEVGITSRKLKIMLKSQQRSTNGWPTQKPIPINDSQSFREAVNRLGPKLRKVMEEDLKTMVCGDKEQEAFREKLTRSMSNEKVLRSISQPDIHAMNIHGLEPKEKSFRRNKNDSFVGLETSTISKKVVETQENVESRMMRSIERSIRKQSSLGPHPSNAASRASVACLTSKELSSQWYETGEEDKVRIDLSRSRAEGESISLLKVLDMVSFNGELKQQAAVNKLKGSVVRRNIGVEESYGNLKKSFGAQDMKDKGPYLKAFTRKAPVRDKTRGHTLSIGLNVDSKRHIGTIMTEEDVVEVKKEAEKYRSNNTKERSTDKNRSRERESEDKNKKEVSLRKSLDLNRTKKGFGEFSQESSISRTKHNMFRFKTIKSSRSKERDESLTRKSQL